MLKLIILSLLVSQFSFAKDPAKGLAIATKADKVNHGFGTEISKMKMILRDSAGNEAQRELEGYILDGNGKSDKTILKFLSPMDVKGTKLLTFSHRTKDDEQWLYLKSLRRVKKISSKSKQAAFLNSEFSFEDLAGQTIEKFSHTWLREDDINGRKVDVIEQVSNVENSAYAKQVTYLDKVMNNPLKIEYYGKQGTMVKVATFSNYKKINEFYRPFSVKMKNLREGSESEFIWETRVLGQKLDKKMFKSSSLKK
jgi:hypothetical protein